MDEPRRGRLVHLGYDAEGALQIVDAKPAAVLVDELAAGLRIFADHLDYASVRRSTAMAPSCKYDVSMVLQRPVTSMEELVSWGNAAHLLPDYVPDAYVAQVLTDSHLAKARDLTMFRVDGSAVAGTWSSPGTWNGGSAASTRSRRSSRTRRRGFGDMILTDVVGGENPPEWVTT